MNKVVHFEIPFDDKGRAMRFYQEVFGWQLNDMPEMNYVMAQSTEIGADYVPTSPGAINGGLTARPAEAPAPVIYLAVDAIDTAIAKVTAAGGKVITPNTPIPGMGAYARVTDSEGNVIGLYQGQ